MSSTTEPPGTASTSSSSTINLFPTTVASGVSTSATGSGSPNVYYLVFVGVLVVLLCLAACLAYRAFRLRRRYRTATQRAIARGDPLPPPMRDDYWGLGGFAAWTSEGMDRMRPSVEERRRKRRKWERIPVLHEAMIGKEGGNDWEEIDPVTLHSLLPPPQPVDPVTPTPTPAAAPQTMGPRPRPPPLISLSHFANRRRSTPAPEPIEHQHKPKKIKEIDRQVEIGEDVRVAVVIQMPMEEEAKRIRYGSDYESDEEDEVGWENGMELGVWEGVVGQDKGLEGRIGGDERWR